MGCQSTSQTPDEVINNYYRKGKFNGSILIAQNDKVIIDTVFGYRDLDQKVELTKETPFYIASLSKPFTAIAIFQLAEKRLLSLDDDAVKFVDDIPSYAHHITIKQLLNHTSGIRDYENRLTKKDLINNEVIHWLQNQDGLAFKPGTKFQYSNSGYIILSLIIEKISGVSYARFLKENIFDLLQMHHTTVFESNTVIPDKAIGYNKDKKVDDYSILTTGDGGIYATAEDLYELDKALRTNQLLSEESTKLLYQTPPILEDGTHSEYGSGWFIEKSDGSMIAQHTGGLAGFRSLFWRDLKNGNTIIALTNQGHVFPVFDFLNDIKKTLK
ncbi:beta-lactamase family protein [Chryseobacterium sp. Y16C]|uniref:serine hydrolase domain-containing protein n=1 Tax=Chryseobacterium sp. Y16C TaxID=2920939 RepID=UPI001F0B3C9D|nr:serine hydrolase domain-containing protein [Chryseobacterium sp. Y16C]UMQ43340.1 beta-lactamase family protein [Chryseobacterium sp. Y16C]